MRGDNDRRGGGEDQYVSQRGTGDAGVKRLDWDWGLDWEMQSPKVESALN